MDSFLAACQHFGASANIKADLTVGQWIDTSSLACSLAEMDPAMPTHVLQRLRDDDAVSVVNRFVHNIDQARSIEERLGLDLLLALRASETQYRRLEPLREVSVLGVSPATLSVADLTTIIDRLDSHIAELGTLKDFGTTLEALIGNITTDSIATTEHVRAILEQAPRRILLLRSESLAKEEHQDRAESICKRGTNLQRQKATLTEAFDLSGLGSVDELREHARTLREGGFFWWVNAKVRDARRLYRRCAYEKETKSNDTIAAAFVSIADILSDCQAFSEDRQAKELLADLFLGLETDFTAIVDLLAFFKDTRTVTADQSRASLSLRNLLLRGDIASVDAFLAQLHSPVYERLKRFLATESWSHLSDQLTEGGYNRGLLAEMRSRVTLDKVPTHYGVAETFEAVQAARNHRDLTLKIEGDGSAKEILHEHFRGMQSNTQALKDAIAYMERLNAPGRKLPSLVLDRLAALDTGAMRMALSLLMPLWLTDAASIAALFDDLQCEAHIDTTAFFGKRELHEVELSAFAERVKYGLDHAETLDDWVRYLHLRVRASDVSGQDLIAHFERDGIEGGIPLSQVFTYLVTRSVVRSAIDKYPALRDFPGVSLQSARERFRELDKRVIETHRAVLAAKLHYRQIDPGNNVGPRGTWTGRALLDNEVNKKKRHAPIRDVVQRAGMALQQMKPCFMMSPLSVAQYLPPGSIDFDLVVIDEASQMKPEDALGALSRGHHAVVVGDPKQLPPTSFFEREIEDEETSDEDAVDNESILLLAMSQYGKRRLRWHYRSKHESLIAFSNHYFYQNDLIVFPSPATPGSHYGVRSHFVGGNYKSGTNPDEAHAVTEAAVRFMKDSPDLSLGIVAINREQRELIYDEMTQLIANDQDATRFVERWDATLYPFFVKNLESVQGDERDVIFISTVYGAEERGGTVAQRFGPILGPSGWRRLNVLFTRARVRVEVFTSMNPADIRVDEKSGQGVRALRNYLDYAMNGRLESGVATQRGPGSDFEIAVGQLLEVAGYEVETQVGVANYYIDLAVRHPRSGSFMVGIECDGATYHSAKYARDRDRTREEALRALGWSLYRIWSTDWFADPRREFTKLEQFLKQLI